MAKFHQEKAQLQCCMSKVLLQSQRSSEAERDCIDDLYLLKLVPGSHLRYKLSLEAILSDGRMCRNPFESRLRGMTAKIGPFTSTEELWFTATVYGANTTHGQEIVSMGVLDQEISSSSSLKPFIDKLFIITFSVTLR